MEVRQVPGHDLFGTECQYEGCRALGPLQPDAFRAMMANNRRGFHSDMPEKPLVDDPRPVLDAAYWAQRMYDPEELCEFRVIHGEHGPGYWASGPDKLQRKLEAVDESHQPGWAFDFRALDHGERSHLSLEEARAILHQCRLLDTEPKAGNQEKSSP